MNIYPYKAGSKSVAALGKAMGCKRLKRVGSQFTPREGKVVLNWGSSELPRGWEGVVRVINSSHSVGLCTNKKKFFEFLEDKDVRVPEVAFSAQEVLLDLCDVKVGKTAWVARTKLTGHSGEGIVLIHGGDKEVVKAPLYTKYIPKKEEYRVHICAGKVFDVQRKARSKDIPDDKVNWQVRSHDNGFIFARNEDHKVPKDVTDQALKAFNEVGLDFGAVDVIYNEKEELAYVLEINTAPGLTGTTLENYAEALSVFKG